MNNDQPFLGRRVVELAAVLPRWLLGALFVYMGLNKALHPVEFLKLVREYDITHVSWLLNSIAALLPWFEVFCGLLLLAGIAVRGAGLMVILMLVPFTIVVFERALGIQAAQGIPFCAVKFDCGCGGGEVFVCRKLLDNLLLIIMSIWLLSGRGRKLCLRHSLV